jgi:predicted O-linked N-acetylglucosamine transferase (SPINDLY family)
MPYGDLHVQRRYRDLFSAHEINDDRIIFSGFSPRHDLLAAYRDVDIGLDPYPYTGGTTTLEALWMGIPVVTLLGNHFVSRITATLLTNAGLKDCVTNNEEQYIAKAVSLASDLPRLGTLRQGLRSQLLNSVLCDGPGFTANLEAAYLRMWEAWCQTQ